MGQQPERHTSAQLVSCKAFLYPLSLKGKLELAFAAKVFRKDTVADIVNALQKESWQMGPKSIG